MFNSNGGMGVPKEKAPFTFEKDHDPLLNHFQLHIVVGTKWGGLDPFPFSFYQNRHNIGILNGNRNVFVSLVLPHSQHAQFAFNIQKDSYFPSIVDLKLKPS